MESMQFRQLSRSSRFLGLQDNQRKSSFCINMRPAQSSEEVHYVTSRNANRPSVICFHGLLNTESSRNQGGASNTFFEEGNQPRRNERISGTDDVTDTTEDEEEEVEDTVQDMAYRNSEDCRLTKRHRTSFTSFQLKRLEEEFDGDTYIIGMKRWHLAEELEIPEKQIKIWFQNRRTKLKKHCSTS